jgi:molybdopterin molybdotransferase
MRAPPIEVEQARAIVLATAAALDAEQVALAEALGRVLAEDVASVAPVPGFDSSAMDGFALRSGDVVGADTGRPAALSVVGESRAGRPAGRALGSGEAIAISTGAVVPPGADAVVAVEQTTGADGVVEVLTAVAPGANVRRAGEDIRPGETVLDAGAVLGAAELGVLASLGRPALACFRRPLVAVIVTGDELADPGEPLAPGSIYNSNRYSIAALARRAGAEVLEQVTVGDDPRSTREAIARALARADAVVLCGGVSVGEHDHVKASLRDLGVEERFWGIALRPGKPTWFGSHGRTLVFGLPGNPVSAMVTFILLVAPGLRALGGAPGSPPRATATLTRDYEKQAGRAHAVRCRLSIGADGWLAEPTGEQGSHILTSMLGADALALIPIDSGSVRAGQRVEIELLDGACAGWG